MDWSELRSGSFAPGVHSATCMRCNKSSFWRAWVVHSPGTPGQRLTELIYPRLVTAPPPHLDLPETVLPDYEEARSISSVSPRGASALLRVCIEKLCDHLGAQGGTLNDRIGDLVKKGLPERVQQSLDAVRVIGNNAVHPGTMDPDDVADVCNSLFALVNVIVEDRITRLKMVDAVYATLPEKARAAIEKRDAAK